MRDKKYKWHKIAESPEELNWAANGMATVEIKGKSICIARFEASFFGFSCKCPHAGGPLSEGYIDAIGNVVCPLHRYKFSIKNGRNTSGEGYALKTYPAECRPDGLFVGLEEGGLLNWL